MSESSDEIDPREVAHHEAAHTVFHLKLGMRAWISIGLQIKLHESATEQIAAARAPSCCDAPVREQVRKPIEPNRGVLTAEDAGHAEGKDLGGAIVSKTCDTITFLKQDLIGNKLLRLPAVAAALLLYSCTARGPEKAFDKGDYATAAELWLHNAEQGDRKAICPMMVALELTHDTTEVESLRPRVSNYLKA